MPNRDFLVGETYSKLDIYRICEVPAERQGGNWDTGYTSWNDDWFIFCNVGTAGRSGHDHKNKFVGTDLVWYGKARTHIRQQSIQSLLNPKGLVLVFYRKSDRDPFTFAGTATARSYIDSTPVQIVWTFGIDGVAPSTASRRVIATQRETTQAADKFRKRIAEISGDPIDGEWGFPNGDRIRAPTYTVVSAAGDIEIGMPSAASDRFTHLFRFARTGGPPSPDVELNVPNTLNRSMSGVYVASGDATWLCTRGGFTAFRGKISKVVALAHFQKWLIDVEDQGRRSDLIPVVALDSDSLADELAEFMQSVLELKQQIKTGTAPIGSQWHSGEEFEGTKKPTGEGVRDEYEYVHGPICNALIRHLRNAVVSQSGYEVGKNKNVDAAVVATKTQLAELIFEVKTAANIGVQLFSAVGQLLIYRGLHGHVRSSLALVLPGHCCSEAANLRKFLDPLDITILIRDGETFRTPSGVTLDDFVRTRLKSKSISIEPR